MASAKTQAITIGLDNRNAPPEHPTWGLYKSNFGEFRATIQGLGYTHVIKNSFTSADLAGLDALVLLTPPAVMAPGFSAEEISAIQAFVQAGGGLLVLGESYSNGQDVVGLNQILGPYGMGYLPQNHSPDGLDIRGFWYHPLTRGIGTVTVQHQLGMLFFSPALDMTIQDTSGQGGDDFLAAWEGDGGAGKVVCVGDSHLWCDGEGGAVADIFHNDNRLLLQNSLRFIVGQGSYECDGPIRARYFRSAFESSDECWEQVSSVPAFVAPGFSRGGGGIGLSPEGSAAAFGYWNSPVLSVEPQDEAFVVFWVVRSTTSSDQCPQFRLRINEAGGRDALYRAVESRLGGENSPDSNDKMYSIVYDPPIGTSQITLAFDLLSFDGTDDLNSTVQLREVRVYPFNI